MLVKPLVSICIPTYNQTTYLAILLRSIARQTFTDYEIIISDDSTTEDVKRLTETFEFGEKISYYKNKFSLGSPANWNAAIEKATGKYIKIMHHDDAFANDTALSEMIRFLETGGYDYIFANSTIENVKDTAQNHIHQIRNFSKLLQKPYLLFFGNSIGGPSSLLMKKKEFISLHYNTKYIWLVDVEYYIRLFESSSKGNFIPSPFILTHDAVEHRLTSTILANFELQIKEQIMLYNYLVPGKSFFARFFMQVFLARLFFKARTKNKAVAGAFVHTPKLLAIYFCLIRFKPLYFAYLICIKCLDVTRKIFFR